MRVEATLSLCKICWFSNFSHFRTSTGLVQGRGRTDRRRALRGEGFRGTGEVGAILL